MNSSDRPRSPRPSTAARRGCRPTPDVVHQQRRERDVAGRQPDDSPARSCEGPTVRRSTRQRLHPTPARTARRPCAYLLDIPRYDDAGVSRRDHPARRSFCQDSTSPATARARKPARPPIPEAHRNATMHPTSSPRAANTFHHRAYSDLRRDSLTTPAVEQPRAAAGRARLRAERDPMNWPQDRRADPTDRDEARTRRSSAP